MFKMTPLFKNDSLATARFENYTTYFCHSQEFQFSHLPYFCLLKEHVCSYFYCKLNKLHKQQSNPIMLQ